MKAWYSPTPAQQKFIEKDLNEHKKRIEKIKSEDRKTKAVDGESSSYIKLSQMRMHNLKVGHNEKLDHIDKDNQFLLNRLVEVTKKKPVVAVSVTPKTDVVHTKSLHAPYRKKEMVRIALENEAFAKRLLSQQSSVNRKKFITDFKKHQDLVVKIKRVNTTSPTKISSQKKLPPLNLEPKQVQQINSGIRTAPEKKHIAFPEKSEPLNKKGDSSLRKVGSEREKQKVIKGENIQPKAKSQKEVEETLPKKGEEDKENKQEKEEVQHEPKEDIKETSEKEEKEDKEDIKPIHEEVPSNKNVKEEEAKEEEQPQEDAEAKKVDIPSHQPTHSDAKENIPEEEGAQNATQRGLAEKDEAVKKETDRKESNSGIEEVIDNQQ